MSVTRDVFVLVRHSVRRRRGLLVALCAVLFFFQIFVILAARGLERSGALTLLGSLVPEFVQQWTNMAGLSFRGMVSFGYSHPIVLLFLIAVAILVGTEPLGEIESRFVDLLMARPVARSAAISRSVALLLGVVTVASVSMLLGTWLGLSLFAPPSAAVPKARVIFSLAGNLAAVVVTWGSIALAIASLSKRRSTAAAMAGFLAFATFVLDYVGRFWDAVKGVSRLSPFHYFNPFALIGGQPLAVTDIAVLVAVSAVGALIAHVAYARRDL